MVSREHSLHRSLRRRSSTHLDYVKVVTLDEVEEQLDASGMEEMRVLVTVHSMTRFRDVYEKGLGLWVAYCIQRYLKQRGIPHKLYMKSIVTKGCWKTSISQVTSFIRANDIDVLIPSDVTDTEFIARHYDHLSPLCKFAVTPNASLYEMLEDKWETYKFCRDYGIPTPHTEKFDVHKKQCYPFFLKIASGTNAGRGVWHCENDKDLLEAVYEAQESHDWDEMTLLVQQPTYGEIICAEVLYEQGCPVGHFFAKSVRANDLSGMGKNYILSQTSENKNRPSHVKVELADYQWKAIRKIFAKIGMATGYHGMIDIEFIVAGPDNAHAVPGSVWLLECNPRFSGKIHTNLSNPAFLGKYFDIVRGVDSKQCSGERRERRSSACRDYSSGVELKAEFGNFNPAGFYARHPLKVLCLRAWTISNYHASASCTCD